MSIYDYELGRKAPIAEAASHGSSYASVTKRVFDLAIILLILPVALPLIVLFACLVALDGSNPFYSQLRVGRDGKHFLMWKLRSMVPDADTRLETLLDTCPESRLEWDSKQKLENDPRVTLVGCILRKTSMDELPQIFNIVTGEMSIVGPRPMMVEQTHLYPGRTYFDLRPGLTGPWQVSDRNASTFAARAKFDDIYAETMSFVTDLRIIAQTVRVVIRGTGC